jgi:hypothetical protein
MRKVLRIKLSEFKKMLREKKGELPAFLKNKKDDKKEPDEDEDDEKQEKLDKSGKKPKKPWEKDEIDEQRRAPFKVSRRTPVPTGRECPEGTTRAKWGKEDAPFCDKEEVVEAKELKELLIKETVNDVTWDMVEILKEALGAETLMEEIIRATEDTEMRDTLEFIAQQHDISLHAGPEELTDAEAEAVYQDMEDEEGGKEEISDEENLQRR